MIKDFRYSTDTLQTWKSFCYSFRYQLQDTVQIHSRCGSHFVAHSDSDFRYSSDTLQTRMPSWYLFRFQLSDTVQICPRHGFHSITYSDFPQLRYAPDTDVILSIIQISNSDTIQIHSRHGSHSVNHSSLVTARIRFKHDCYSFAHTDSVSWYSSDTFPTRKPFWILILLNYNLQLSKQSWMASTRPSPTRFYHLSKWHL